MVLSYGDLMHLCASFAPGYFPIVINTNAYITISIFVVILRGSFLHVVSGSMSVH